METIDIEQRALRAGKKRVSPSSRARYDDVKSPSRCTNGVAQVARRPYVKPAFEHQFVFKRLLMKADGTVAIDQ